MVTRSGVAGCYTKERDRTKKFLAEAAERQRELEERTTKMSATTMRGRNPGNYAMTTISPYSACPV